jgi:hypothetical protein
MGRSLSMGRARALTGTTSTTVEDGCIKTTGRNTLFYRYGLPDFNTVCGTDHSLSKYMSCVILNLICNRIFLYVRFTGESNMNFVMYSVLRGITPNLCRRILLMLSSSTRSSSYRRLERLKVLGCPVSPVPVQILAHKTTCDFSEQVTVGGKFQA